MITKLLLSLGLVAWLAFEMCVQAIAIPITATGSTSLGLAIPDNDLNGLASTITLNAPFNVVTEVTLTVDISGGFNGDYYAYLQHGAGLVVLLNNLGSSVSNPYGSPGGGFNVTFSETAASIATAPLTAGSPLTGTWAPQSASLSTFSGADPNGDWTFFIADLSPGGVGRLDGVGLGITDNEVTVVPDDSRTFALLALGASSLILWLRASYRFNSPATLLPI